MRTQSLRQVTVSLKSLISIYPLNKSRTSKRTGASFDFFILPSRGSAFPGCKTIEKSAKFAVFTKPLLSVRICVHLWQNPKNKATDRHGYFLRDSPFVIVVVIVLNLRDSQNLACASGTLALQSSSSRGRLRKSV